MVIITVTFQGLSSSSAYFGLLDAVKLNNNLIPNGGFESPPLQSDDPDFGGAGDTVWSYDEDSGISTARSWVASGNPSPLEGNQVGFIQGQGAISQSFTVPAGTYTLSFAAAQSISQNFSNNSFIGLQQFRVTLWTASPGNVKTFLWNGNTIAEQRDATGANVVKRYFAEGEQRVGGSDAGNYYYTRDHLGSIREVTDSNGNLIGQFDYDAWGNQTVVNGNMDADFGFTGHYFHEPSGLYLTPNRAYNPTLARWISRDPLTDAEAKSGLEPGPIRQE